MKVHLVENCENSPGRILAVFRYSEDAEVFANAQKEECCVVERTLWHKQPPELEYNE